jgi:two-component system CheB/CheR fusion protein
MGPNVKMRESGPDAGFPIVGIGASAGGLNALHCFIGVLPKKFGFAVVFLQHLSPKHKSLLPELLHNRRPDIPIQEISDSVKILPGKIYLCPPGKEVSLQKGVFHVVPLSKDHLHLPIDEFFASLAEEAGERAIGVIFSGAGTDGARGVQAVRMAGGSVFVQDPATADFPAMPRAAVGTGQADGVFPPDDIAREILKLQGAGTAPPSPEIIISAGEFETFNRLIQEKAGQRFNHYKKGVVGRRIRRRMFLRGISSVRDYIQTLEEKEGEAAQLAADLMIGVTSFFRDKLAWKALKIGVIRKLAAMNDDAPVRVWAPACATGEEAYSIAMLLQSEFELSGRRREIQVFATDVNDMALEKAREGTYPGSIAADVPPEFMQRFFAGSENGLSVTIGGEVREMVVFARQDLLTDPPFSRLDLIICRNLLIYLEPDAQEKCIALFHYALKVGGYLFLGNAESVGRNSIFFKSLGHKKCRVYQKVEAKPSSRLPLAVPFAAERAAPAFPKQASPAECQHSVVEFVQESLIQEYTPAAVAIDQNYFILYHNGPTNRYLRQPRGAPTLNLLELLPQTLRNRIRGAIYRVTQETKPVAIRAIIPEDGRNRPEPPLPKGKRKTGPPLAKGKKGNLDAKRQVTLRISKLRENLFLIVFREKTALPEETRAVPLEASPGDETAVLQLESELASTRAELQSNIEQLKSLNEELQSSNEELQAANEELETSREELQSLNEELITVNSQLQSKIEEQEETNNDLNNFLASTNIPTVFLDTGFRVKRFTPAMSRLLKLIPSDVGRPIIDMSQECLGPELISDARAVLDNLVPAKKEITINGSWYIRAVLPYRTSDNRIEGVVITYSDVSELKRVEELTRHLASFPQLNPNPVIEVGPSGKITFSNPAAYKVLENLGIDREDLNVFLPADMDDILRDLEKKEETTHYREIPVKDRLFGTTIHLVPRFSVGRIYSFDITEQKRAEGALRKAHDDLELRVQERTKELEEANETVKAERQRFYDVLEMLPAYVVLLTPDYHVPFANRFFRERFGDSCGRRCYEYLFDLTEPCPICETYTVMKTSAPHHWEWTGPDGRNYDIYDFPFTDTDGSPLIMEVGIDITERKQAEEGLRKVNETLEQRVAERTAELTDSRQQLERHLTQLKTIFDSLSEGLVVADLEGNLFHWNPAAVAMHGFASMEEAVRRLPEFADTFELSTPEKGILPVEQWPLARILRGETLNDWEVHIRRHSADWQRIFSYGGKLALDKEGKPLLAVITVADITDRKRAEAGLRASEERLKRAQEIAHLGSWELDLVNNVLSWSDEVYRLFGLEPQEFDATYSAFLDAIHPDDKAAVDSAYSGSIREGKDTYEIEHRVVRKSTGEIRHVHEKCEHFRDESGRIIRSVGMVHDITERKKAEAEVLKLSEDMAARNVELEAVNRELESFIYSISHDLRAPLRTMSGFSRIVVEDYAERLDEQGKDFLHRIMRASEKMTGLIDDLLHLSKISRQEMGRSKVDMSKIASSVVAELHEREPGRPVEADIRKDLVAFADPRVMEIVLSNLLGNAWKFTSKTEHPRIEFGTMEQNKKSIFFVRDNGAGFSPECAGKMFLPFHRLHSDDEFEGTGIGLTIVERIIHRHGGRVWADGEVGKGATVYFTLK